MNHNCNGDFYKLHGETFYRCLLDSTIVNIGDDVPTCPNCQRHIDAEPNQGEVEARTFIVTRVRLRGVGWVRHSSSEVHP